MTGQLSQRRQVGDWCSGGRLVNVFLVIFLILESNENTGLDIKPSLSHLPLLSPLVGPELLGPASFRLITGLTILHNANYTQKALIRQAYYCISWN